MKYTNATVTGSNISGVISTLGAIISMTVSTNGQINSIIFFILAIAFTAIQLLTTSLLFKNVSITRSLLIMSNHS